MKFSNVPTYKFFKNKLCMVICIKSPQFSTVSPYLNCDASCIIAFSISKVEQSLFKFPNSKHKQNVNNSDTFFQVGLLHFIYVGTDCLCCCFTWMAVSDVALQFSLKLVREPTLSKRKLNEQLDYISYRR